MAGALSRVLREPLLHFLLIGAAMFAAYGLMGRPDAAADSNRIVVTAGDVERLASFFQTRRMRAPTPEEMNGLVADFVHEDVIYREAMALGLDRDDAAVRRLLVQKYEFLTQDLAVDREPDRAELVAWYDANRDRYETPPRLSFTQVYFDLDRRGSSGQRDALVTLASLRKGTATPTVVGDGLLLDATYRDRSQDEISALFGRDFSEAVSRLEPGVWAGPIKSGYGIHLVRLDARNAGGVRSFEEVADRVRADWGYDQRSKANDAIYRRLLAKYEVVVERPSGPADPASGAEVRP